MDNGFDIKNFSNLSRNTSQYAKQLERLKNNGYNTQCIEETVEAASGNLRSKNPVPFIIYGEPQSGKTEMMICLSAKLVDDDFQLIIALLNDSVDLLNQNLGRFQSSRLAPSPRNFTEILDLDIRISQSPQVVFCKKNSKDLQKLIDKIDSLGRVVIIDDEADYASPNSQVNKGAKSKINDLIDELKGNDGLYIGVTATPARLDLNNTFGNVAAQWVEFKAHKKYTGQENFFPVDKPPAYSLKLLPDKGDKPDYPIEAFLQYLVASAFLNSDKEELDYVNYSMLVHTSAKIADHKKDTQIIHGVVASLVDNISDKFSKYVEQIWRISKSRYPDKNSDVLTNFIVNNISQYKPITLNSKRDITVSGADASNPKSLFTVIFGGNIVSRGVTFNNLLSMYFTRNVKHKIQQDTYIQRARMFGVRGDYLKHFELTIPESLYNDWHRCFVYHKLSLDGARANNSPMWITDQRVSAVAPSSIDKVNIFQSKSSEMSFGLFDHTDEIGNLLLTSNNKPQKITISEIRKIADSLGQGSIPDYLLNFINTFEQAGSGITWYESSVITGKEDSERGDDFSKIFRSRGFWGQFNRDRDNSSVHHFKIFYNEQKKARVFYRYNCNDIKSLRFLYNTANQ